MRHTLKIWPEFYAKVKDGSKTFEVRNNDRDFKEGDEVVLWEYDPQRDAYTGSDGLKFIIGYVYKLNVQLVVFSLLKPKGE